MNPSSKIRGHNFSFPVKIVHGHLVCSLDCAQPLDRIGEFSKDHVSSVKEDNLSDMTKPVWQINRLANPLPLKPIEKELKPY